MKKYATGEIGLRLGQTCSLLIWQLVALVADYRVFVPLCGKPRYIAWLLRQG